jgi:outer membrane protein OmpA-like peptidoglycan-associated protein
MKCPACGHDNTVVGALFCGACGRPLSRASGAQRWIIGGAVVGALAIVLIGFRAVHARGAAHASQPAPAPAADVPPAAPPQTEAPHWAHSTISTKLPPGSNLVSPDSGGDIASITAAYGPGMKGYLLLGASDTASGWQPDTLVYPLDIVLSFYARDTALVSAVVVTHTAGSNGPKTVEIWASKDSASGPFTPVTTATLDDAAHVQAVSFPPVMARYIKVRVDSGPSDNLQIQRVQVLEGSAPGYESMLERHSDIPEWKTAVRHAAQRGVEWLEPYSMDWHKQNNCFGCHVQAQTMMGLSIAQTNNYVVSVPTLEALADITRLTQDASGYERDLGSGTQTTPTHFAAMGFAYYDEAEGVKTDATLRRYVNWMTSHVNPTGEYPQDMTEAPIAQGTISSTANAVVAFSEALAQTGDSIYKTYADRGLAFIDSAQPRTMQDRVFKIMALSRYGSPEQRQMADRLAQQIQGEQDKDGGWREAPELTLSSVYATGQVLYAFKEAGVSTTTPAFTNGVRYLLRTQQPDGSWPMSDAGGTLSRRPSKFAPTMWAVIGLVGRVEPPAEDSMKAALEKTGRIVLYINFDFNKATLRPDSKPIIAQVVKLLRDNPSYAFAVNGHTDNVGAHDYNLMLSKQRAAAVVAALVAAQIAPNRLSSDGFGPDQPIAKNSTEKGRALNRRVELVKR